MEVGNNRKALQETEKLLKKHPNMWCARALKALALLRLGRYEESQIVLKTVSNEKPIDDPTLQVLSFCYKELEQRKFILNIFVHESISYINVSMYILKIINRKICNNNIFCKKFCSDECHLIIY